jgi:hypothetical protein
MEARDLRAGPPRRWNEEIDGIPWLPRLIDKARALQRGTLGTYLYGQSPTDKSLLQTLGLGHRSFAELIAGAGNDEAVLAAIAARDPLALERARAWGHDLGKRHGWFFFLLDIDDGYTAQLGPLCPIVHATADAFSWTAKRLWPSRIGTTK